MSPHALSSDDVPTTRTSSALTMPSTASATPSAACPAARSARPPAPNSTTSSASRAGSVNRRAALGASHVPHTAATKQGAAIASAIRSHTAEPTVPPAKATAASSASSSRNLSKSAAPQHHVTVQRGSDGPDRIDRVVAGDPVAGEDRGHDGEDLRARLHVLGVAGLRRNYARVVASRVPAGIRPVGVCQPV